MVTLDEFGRPDRYELSGGGKFPDGYKKEGSGIKSYSYKQVSWEDAQKIVDKYKKQIEERKMKTMKPMKPMKTRKQRLEENLEDKVKEK